MYPNSYSSTSSNSSSDSLFGSSEMQFGLTQRAFNDEGYEVQAVPMPLAVNNHMNYHSFQQEGHVIMDHSQVFGVANEAMQENTANIPIGPNYQHLQPIGFPDQHFHQFPANNYSFSGYNGVMDADKEPCAIDEFKLMGSMENRPPKRSSKNKVKKVSTMHQNSNCANCGCRETKLWRRNEKGEPECNPCNLYERLKGHKRPERLWNKPPSMRRRRPVAPINAISDN